METTTLIDFSKLSLKSLCEIYAASHGICMGWTEKGKTNLAKRLEYELEHGTLKMPEYPSERLQKELSL